MQGAVVRNLSSKQGVEVSDGQLPHKIGFGDRENEQAGEEALAG